MSQATVFGELSSLPHGPHRISADQVAASQIARLRAAIFTEVASNGYAATTVTAVVRRARVSPNVFYLHYADKQACFRDALDVAAATVIGLPVDDPHSTEELVARLVRPYLALIEAEPDAARTMMIEIDAAGPQIRRRRRELFAVAATELRRAHEGIAGRPPGADRRPVAIYLAILHAGHGLVCDWLEEHPGEPATKLQPALTELLTTLLGGISRESSAGA